MGGLTCITCGGKEFFTDAGFYFCSECQTQAAGVQEQEVEPLQHADDSLFVAPIKKVKSSSSSKTPKTEQITSWECYNFILLGLVNELIELGADERLKPIVQTIWFKYMKKLQVIHKNRDKPPFLPAYNHKHDAKIIFGRSGKKKIYKRKRTTSASSASSVSGSESTVSRREQHRLNRAMAKAMYESQQSSVPSDSSLCNISLGSLKSTTSDKAKENFLSFSKAAKAELSNHMPKRHLQEHIEDVDSSLDCHNLSYRKVSEPYRKSANIMTQTKLYAILYLGLLINKDDIHLGDMLRFMNEGSLSYNYYHHFFPEDIDAQTGFLNSFKVSKVFKHEMCRTEAGKIAELLNLDKDIPTPNILNLIIRFCNELNLPTEICNLSLNFIASLQPTMKIRNHTIPNYEGRAMCVIIFVLKLLFGLDDVTEIHLSSFGDKINSHLTENMKLIDDNVQEMFSFMDWLKTVLYRRFVLAKHHFITGFDEKDFSNQDFLDFMKAYYEKYDIQRLEDLDYENIERVLSPGESNFDSDEKKLQFAPSMTPLRDNLKLLHENNKLTPYNLNILMKSYEFSSVEYLREPSKFFGTDTEILDRGANNNVKLVPIFQTQKLYSKGRDKVTCRLSNGEQFVPEVEVVSDEIDTDNVMTVYDIIHAKGLNSAIPRPSSDLRLNVGVYEKHFRPEKRYWLRLGANLSNLRCEGLNKFWENFPYHFRLVMDECAKISGQSVRDLIIEFNYFECYVCYENLFSDDCHRRNKFRKGGDLNLSLMKLVKSAKENW